MKSFREWHKDKYLTDFPESWSAERYDFFLLRQMERMADFMDYLAAEQGDDGARRQHRGT